MSFNTCTMCWFLSNQDSEGLETESLAAPCQPAAPNANMLAWACIHYDSTVHVLPLSLQAQTPADRDGRGVQLGRS